MTVDSPVRIQLAPETPPPPPNHVAIIMDGNGRWAKARGLPRTAGHKQGAEAVKKVVRAAGEMGVRYLTLFGFSSENWSRPVQEVRDLMGLLRQMLQRHLAELNENQVRLRVIGDRSKLPPEIRDLLSNAETVTCSNTGLNLTVALSYGGRQELLAAARTAIEEAAAGRLEADDLTEARFRGYMDSADIPDPDLLIRTSGEQRLSNFLLWQMAYAELVFTDVLWPDFGEDELKAAVDTFARRERRYGALSPS